MPRRGSNSCAVYARFHSAISGSLWKWGNASSDDSSDVLDVPVSIMHAGRQYRIPLPGLRNAFRTCRHPTRYAAITPRVAMYGGHAERCCSAVWDVQIRTSILASGQHRAGERAVRLIGVFGSSVPAFFRSYSGLLLAANFSAASFSAVDRASVALTFTSGSTPVPSQSPFVTGLMGRAKGTPMVK